MQTPVTGASGNRFRSLPFYQPHRSRTGPCWRRSQGPTSSSKGPPTMNPAVQLATFRRAAAGPKCGRLVLRQLSSAAAAHTHTAWHARRPSPPTSDPGGTAPRARCGRRTRLQPSAGDAGQRAHGALTVAPSGVCRRCQPNRGRARHSPRWWFLDLGRDDTGALHRVRRSPHTRAKICQRRLPGPSAVALNDLVSIGMVPAPPGRSNRIAPPCGEAARAPRPRSQATRRPAPQPHSAPESRPSPDRPAHHTTSIRPRRRPSIREATRRFRCQQKESNRT